MSHFKSILPVGFDGNVFFSSDWHLNHTNITGPDVSNWKDGYRNFNSTYEMNKHIIKNINVKVKWNDILIFHGDFCFKNHKLTPNWRNSINCQTIHWITGNHDNHAHLYANNFTSVQSYMEYSVYGQDIVSFHYPIFSWNGIGKGIWCCHGHTHAHPNIQKANLSTKRLDVGIDSYYEMFGTYDVFSFEEISKIMNNKSIQIVDGHNEKTNVR